MGAVQYHEYLASDASGIHVLAVMEIAMKLVTLVLLVPSTAGSTSV